jgi:hypothetical protein
LKYQAEAEHQRLKGLATASTSTHYVWCATDVSVIKMFESSCRSRNGKGFSTKTQAQAEHERLKRLSSSSSTASTVETLQIWGGTYIGEVVDGLPHGQGTWTYPNGNKYVGEYKNGKKNGKGTYTWPDGHKYVGEFKDGKRHGQGTYTWADGRKYVGEYKNGKEHGQGTYTFANGNKYVGEYKDGKGHGQGTYTWANGNKYVGEYKDGEPWEGIHYLTSGQVWGTASNGKACKGCTPTARQLAIVRQINPSQIAATPTPAQNLTLTIRSSPTNAKVYIDSNYKGSTRLALDLPKGQHTIRIEKDGYEPYEETVNLTDNLIIRGHLAKVIEQPAQTTTVQPSTVDNTAEIEFWKSIKDSNDRDMYRAYIDQFPEGVYVSLAKIKLKTLGGDSAVATIPDIAYGDYYALVIGNNEYQHLGDLGTAVNDAKAVAQVLKDDYGFDVNLISNATRADMFAALEHYRRTSTSQDNLLIYYAGHGYLDQEADEGFWLPVDADEDSQLNWVPNADIIRSVSSMRAKHVMVVADSCFSGTLIRALAIKQKTPDYLSRIAKKKTRVAMTSGSEEPVTDVGGGGNSAFAKAFLTLLNENTGVIDGHSMFTQLRRRVMINTKQTPQYGDMRGHEDGDFLFVRQ